MLCPFQAMLMIPILSSTAIQIHNMPRRIRWFGSKSRSTGNACGAHRTLAVANKSRSADQLPRRGKVPISPLFHYGSVLDIVESLEN